MRFVENDTRTETPSNQEVHTSVTIADIWEAYKLLKPRLHHTPLAHLLKSGKYAAFRLFQSTRSYLQNLTSE